MDYRVPLMSITTLDVAVEKTCTGCRQTRPIEDFCRSRSASSGRDPRCRACHAERARERRDSDPEAHRERQRQAQERWRFAHPLFRQQKYVRDRYGTTPEILLAWAEAKFIEQSGKCACCGRQGAVVGMVAVKGVTRLVVDHNHETNELRGLLCDQCNTALGMLQDSPEVVASLLTYIGGWTPSL